VARNPRSERIDSRQVPLPPVLFVGREQELARLRNLAQQVRVVVVCGIAGIGKSALAHAFAAAWKGPKIHRKLMSGDSLTTVIDDARRDLGRHASRATLAADVTRLAELTARIEKAAALWVIDDLHVLGDQGPVLVAALARLRRGLVVATSREHPAPTPGDPDHGLLHLHALDDRGARALWATLDELYGTSSAIETALRHARGNPFLLRRAHAGNLDEVDPISDAVAELSPDEFMLAAVLSLSRVRLPLHAIAPLLDGDRARTALRRMVARMIVETDATGACGVHDLFRESIVRRLTPETRHAAHEALTRIMSNDDLTGVDSIVRVRALGEHLKALGRFDDLSRLILDHAVLFVRGGAAGDLLAMVEDVPASHRSIELDAARVRVMLRLLDLRRARAEVAAMVQRTPEPSGDLLVTLGQVALLAGDLDVAEDASRTALRRSGLPAGVLSRAQFLLAAVMGYRGHIEDALAFLDGLAPQERRHCANLELARTLVLWIAERPDEALARLNASETLFKESVGSFRHASLTAYFAALRGQAGQMDAAERALDAAHELAACGDDRRMKAEVRFMGALLHCEAGRHRQAIAQLEELLDSFQTNGFVIDALLTRVWMGRARLRLGQRREAMRMLDEASKLAGAIGAGAIVATAERLRAHEPIRRLECPPSLVPSSKAHEVTSVHAYEALRAAVGGQVETAERLLEACAGAVAGATDFPLERLLVAVAWEGLDRLTGRPHRRETSIRAAASRAIEEGVDPDLVTELVSVLGPGPASVVLDARDHELHVAGKRLSLGRSPTVRGLLYALARDPGRVLTNDEITSEVWHAAPRRARMYDNAIRVAVRRLRLLLRGTPVRIDSTDEGYRLMVPRDFALVESAPEAPPSSGEMS
jgi:tetratricopeptide (TPR) repeat protein